MFFLQDVIFLVNVFSIKMKEKDKTQILLKNVEKKLITFN